MGLEYVLPKLVLMPTKATVGVHQQHVLGKTTLDNATVLVLLFFLYAWSQPLRPQHETLVVLGSVFTKAWHVASGNTPFLSCLFGQRGVCILTEVWEHLRTLLTHPYAHNILMLTTCLTKCNLKNFANLCKHQTSSKPSLNTWDLKIPSEPMSKWLVRIWRWQPTLFTLGPPTVEQRTSSVRPNLRMFFWLPSSWEDLIDLWRSLPALHSYTHYYGTQFYVVEDNGSFDLEFLCSEMISWN